MFKRRRRKLTLSFVPPGDSGEHHEQCTFFALIRKTSHPAKDLTVAIPNQALAILPKMIRLHFWREGCKGGVPDLVTFYPQNPYHGLLIEMKYGSNGPGKDQHIWLRSLSAVGYKVSVCYSGEEAFRVWCDYLGIR